LRIFFHSSEAPQLRRVEQRGCGFPTQAGVLLLTVLATLSFADSDSHSPPLLSTDLIVQKLMAANAQRSQALRGYSGKRVYHLDYHGIFGSHDAGMQVEATYTAPNRKEFKIVSESGSKLLINHVLLKLLSSEQEAQEEQNRKELEISPRNYDFSLVGTEHTQDRDFYVLAVKPKGSSKYLYRGKMWVDAKDFAVVRIEGEPGKNPSFWIKKTEIAHRYIKVNDFWLPAENHTESLIRLGGHAILSIEYRDYKITKAAPLPVENAREDPRSSQALGIR